MSLKDATFGAYTIVRQLSIGDTSEIYLARRGGFAGFERFVVIKCIPDHLSRDSKFVEQFRDEARLVARLSHPNIVPVHEFGQAGETHYLVMEYIPGIALEEAIGKTFGIEPSHALRIASEMCSGLAYAHGFKDDAGKGAGVVHRNVNPQNVLLGFDGSVKLIDFGIAKAATTSNETRTAFFKGRYGYLAPEQVSGEAVDHRADIHAVAVTLWEMLMGFPLYDRGNAVDTVEAVLHQTPSPVRRRHPDLPATIDECLARALAKHPDERHQSAVELQEVIDEVATTSGRLSTTTALGQLVRTCADASGPGGASAQALHGAPLRTATTSVDRLQRASVDAAVTKREGRPDDDAETNELIAPTKARPVTPVFGQAPTLPPPTLRVAPLTGLATTQDDDDHERLDPTIPMPWKQAPSSGINVHLARLEELAAAEEGSDGRETPGQPRATPATSRSEHRGSTAMWIASSAIGVALVTAVTFVVLRGDVLESLTGWSIGATPRAVAPRVDGTIVNEAPRGLDASLATTPTVSPTPQNTDPVEESPERTSGDGGDLSDDLPTAFLTIRSDPPGAQLFIDGYPAREWTNFHDLPIDPGAHTFELALLGYRRWRQTMTVDEGQRVVLRVHLYVHPEGESEDEAEIGLPDFGILSVTTMPPSLVYLGRKSLGQTPVSDIELPTGDHRLTFVLEDGTRINRSIKMLSGRTTRHVFDLRETRPPERAPTKERTQPTKTDAQPTKTDAQPTKTDAQPTKTDAQPTKTDAQPTKTDAQPTKTDAQPTTPKAAPSTGSTAPRQRPPSPSVKRAQSNGVEATKAAEGAQ